jgi:hypothetical protein
MPERGKKFPGVVHTIPIPNPNPIPIPKKIAERGKGGVFEVRARHPVVTFG